MWWGDIIKINPEDQSSKDQSSQSSKDQSSKGLKQAKGFSPLLIGQLNFRADWRKPVETGSGGEIRGGRDLRGTHLSGFDAVSRGSHSMQGGAEAELTL
jgi:hypothetical protein